MNCSVADCRHTATAALAMPAHGIPSSSGLIGGIGGVSAVPSAGESGPTPKQEAEHREATEGAAGTSATILETGTEVTTGSAGVTTASRAALGRELLEHAWTRQLCREHARQARCEAVRLYLVQLRARSVQVGEVEARMSRAEAGTGALEDVVFLEGYIQLLAAVAQVVECENDLAWKQAAAVAEQRREVLAKLLYQHMF
ncbi:hypothetical protein [Quadrisphaera sp. INWT6]|uniref:hypothetical protein n=1 Tax=Quadrisphaera sp. INWT6 TaxID=2596917 RepID=UPI001891F4B0|nr:hypothetical protein [Quadrisphaera sp. INWT6]MBF5081174.1 hypothetical protein [Quadrisphaera sp. INWT6]